MLVSGLKLVDLHKDRGRFTNVFISFCTLSAASQYFAKRAVGMTRSRRFYCTISAATDDGSDKV